MILKLVFKNINFTNQSQILNNSIPLFVVQRSYNSIFLFPLSLYLTTSVIYFIYTFYEYALLQFEELIEGIPHQVYCIFIFSLSFDFPYSFYLSSVITHLFLHVIHLFHYSL